MELDDDDDDDDVDDDDDDDDDDNSLKDPLDDSELSDVSSKPELLVTPALDIELVKQKSLKTT
jgi:hypothetical protein